MKLKVKIMLIFCATIIACVATVGLFASNMSATTVNNIQEEKLNTAATLAASDVGTQLSTYLKTVAVAGHDQILTNPSLPNEYKQAIIDMYVQAYGFVSGNILDANGISIFDGTDFSDRDYYLAAIKGNYMISEITQSRYTGTYGTSLAAPLVSSTGEILGVLYFRVDIDFLLNILDDLKVSDNSIAYIVNAKNQIVAYPDQDYILKDASELDMEDAIIGEGVINEDMGLKIFISAPESDFKNAQYKLINSLIACTIVSLLLGLLVAGLFTNSLNKPIVKVKNALLSIAHGDLSSSLKKTGRKDEIGILQNTAAELVQTLQQIIGDTNNILGSMSDYNLNVPDMTEYPGDYNEISNSVNRIKEIITYLIIEVQASASNVKVGAKQLADATALLSNGATTQSSSIDKLLSEMNEVAASINRSSENGKIINKQLKNLEQEIDEGNTQMNQLSTVVEEIEEMSSDIQKIVGTIDSISFQTNILALNASVEAARAGENGRGFAVVAEEVSALAAKSSEASKRTGELIDKCIAGIQEAKKCADQTSASLNNIVTDSKKIAIAFGEIAEGTEEEAIKANSIKEEVNNISAVVQSNSSSTMETAASTEELSSQAVSLEEMISKFNV